MKRGDPVSGLILLIFSLFALYQSSRLSMVYGSSPGSGFLPFSLSLAMAALSIVVIVEGALRPTSADLPLGWPSGKGLRRILMCLASLAVYTYMTTVIGYILSTFGFVLLLVWMLGAYRWYQAVAFSLAAAVGLYIIFQIWLEMVLPTGLLIIP